MDKHAAIRTTLSVTQNMTETKKIRSQHIRHELTINTAAEEQETHNSVHRVADHTSKETGHDVLKRILPGLHLLIESSYATCYHPSSQ